MLKSTPHTAKAPILYTKDANAADPAGHQPLPRELPTIPPELTSELLHCLSTLPDPWPLAKITINMGSASQWVSKMWIFFADEFVRHTVGTYTSKQLPQQEIALKAVRAALKHVLDTRSPHLAFMLVKEYWFRELYLGLKVAASFDRNESYQ